MNVTKFPKRRKAQDHNLGPEIEAIAEYIADCPEINTLAHKYANTYVLEADEELYWELYAARTKELVLMALGIL